VAANTQKLPYIERVIHDAAREKIRMENELMELRNSIRKLYDELRIDTFAITEINENLHMFLGHNDINLEHMDEGR
jgi:wobble nucleotide-excising tRNase